MEGKIDESYIGLYIITKHYGKGIYSLQGVTDPDYIIPRVSDAQLKPYIDQPDDMQTFHQVIIVNNCWKVTYSTIRTSYY